MKADKVKKELVGIEGRMISSLVSIICSSTFLVTSNNIAFILGVICGCMTIPFVEMDMRIGNAAGINWKEPLTYTPTKMLAYSFVLAAMLIWFIVFICRNVI